jgi:hypothetical protein
MGEHMPNRKQENPKYKRPEYQAYFDAKVRCNNPTHRLWKYYGGRGIKFLFTSFEQFFEEIGPRISPVHSLDRKNNDGNYEPGNVKWSTKSEQVSNRRPYTQKKRRKKGYRLIPRLKKYLVKIHYAGTVYHIGVFKYAKEAQQAYETALEKLMKGSQ